MIELSSTYEQLRRRRDYLRGIHQKYKEIGTLQSPKLYKEEPPSTLTRNPLKETEMAGSRLSKEKELFRAIIAEELKKAVAELRGEIKSISRESQAYQDPFARRRHVAVRFPNEEMRLLGEKVLFAKTRQGVGLREGIHLIWEEDLVYLDRAGVKYAMYYPNTNDLTEVYKAFGI
jgi:hypothetical protein